MTEQKVKRNLIIITVVSVLVIFTLVIMLCYQYATYWSLRDQQLELDRQLDILQQEYNIYKTEYDYKSSEEFVEDYAREVLGWGKEGSTYYK